MMNMRNVQPRRTLVLDSIVVARVGHAKWAIKVMVDMIRFKLQAISSVSCFETQKEIQHRLVQELPQTIAVIMLQV